MHKLCILVFVACATSAVAQVQESGTEAEDRNFIELFVGITHDDGENEASLGLTYEHRFGRFGTGFIAEFTMADRRETVLALPFFWHPADPWRTVVAIARSQRRFRGPRHRTGFWRQFRLEILTFRGNLTGQSPSDALTSGFQA